MFCTNCGAQIAEGSVHCTSCGTRVDGVGAVAFAARNAYAGMDRDLKRSLMLGGGSLASTILAILLAGPASILLLILIPASIVLGSFALNAGRNLDNRAGYHLGMIGLSTGTFMLYMFLFGYAARSIAMSAAGSAVGSLFRL